MSLLQRLKATVVCAAACGVVLTAVLVVAPAQARVIRLSNGRVFGVMLSEGARIPAGATTPHRLSAANPGCDRVTNDGVLSNQCGLVVHSSKPYLIFWDPSGIGISATSEQLMERYLTDTATAGTAANDVYGVDRQYFDSTGYAGQSESFSASTQAIVDTQSYPSPDTYNCHVSSSFTACVTDTQVQAEISRLITANHWPNGGVSTNAPIYFVVLPKTTDECINHGGGCADTAFCAYHSWYASDVLYAVVPFALGSGCQSNGLAKPQSPNADLADFMIDNLSHEYNEVITDPVGTGWVNKAYGWEAADLCEETGAYSVQNATDPNAYLPTLGGDANGGTLYDQLINGDEYYTQTVWSNRENDCRTQPSLPTATFTAPSIVPVGRPAAFDGSGSNDPSGGSVSSYHWSFGDGTSGTGAQPQHTFTQPGTYTVSLTVTDSYGLSSAPSTHTVTVSAASPIAAPVASPTVAATGQTLTFQGAQSTDPNAGGSIIAYRWSFGDGSTSTASTSQHVYTSPGTYTVQLSVTDNYDQTGTRTTQVVIVAPGRIERTAMQKKHGVRYLLVSVSQAGTVAFGKRPVQIAHAGTVRFKLSLSHAQAQQLAKHHPVRLKVTLVYKPLYGPQAQLVKKLTVKG